MIFLSAAAQTGQPDYVALAMVVVLLVIVAVMALKKKFAKKPAPEAAAPAAPVSEAEPQRPTAPGSAGQVKLHDVAPKTAAMLMAIVADKTGKPLNELRFISIKEIKES